MAEPNLHPSIDPKSGFCSETKIFHSLRPPVSLPPETEHLSAAEFAFSLHRSISCSPETTALIDSATGHRLSYSEFVSKTETLAASLQTLIGLSRGDTAFILSPTCFQIPILYFALLSLGVVISPGNPTSTKSEISSQIALCKPVIAFATSAAAHKLPSLHHTTVLLDSSEFHSMMTIPSGKLNRVHVNLSDAAAILYSSGTTGPVKGVVLSHMNLISMLAGVYSLRQPSPSVVLCTVPFFHVYGLIYSVKWMVVGETLVLMERFDLRQMMRAVDEFRVTHVSLAPPVLVAMTKRHSVIDGHDLSSLRVVLCGGASLGKEVIERFKERFPNVHLAQAYGLTESTGGAFRSVGPDEYGRLGSTGRLVANCEAKIVDPDTGVALPPCKQGELWIRGPTIMKGYIGDGEATAATLHSEGWLRTGDLCYMDNDGFLFVVDRLKELIKYKGYQVAPAELEQLLLSHPDIIDAAVIPYPNEEAGQVPMAFVVRQPQRSLSEAQVMDFIAKQVAPYKKIKRVSFINAVPKNAQGKLLRKELIKLALSNPTSKL